MQIHEQELLQLLALLELWEPLALLQWEPTLIQPLEPTQIHEYELLQPLTRPHLRVPTDLLVCQTTLSVGPQASKLHPPVVLEPFRACRPLTFICFAWLVRDHVVPAVHCHPYSLHGLSVTISCLLSNKRCFSLTQHKRT